MDVEVFDRDRDRVCDLLDRAGVFFALDLGRDLGPIHVNGLGDLAIGILDRDLGTGHLV